MRQKIGLKLAKAFVTQNSCQLVKTAVKQRLSKQSVPDAICQVSSRLSNRHSYTNTNDAMVLEMQLLSHFSVKCRTTNSEKFYWIFTWIFLK